MGPVKAVSWATWFNGTALIRANSNRFVYSLLHSLSPHTRMHSLTHTRHPDSQLNSQKTKGGRWLWLGPWAEHECLSSTFLGCHGEEIFPLVNNMWQQRCTKKDIHHITPPCFYCSPEQTNQPQALHRAIRIRASAPVVSSPSTTSQTVSEKCSF